MHRATWIGILALSCWASTIVPAISQTTSPTTTAPTTAETTAAENDVGACRYLSYWDGLPVERNVTAAFRGDAKELIVGGLGIRGDVDLYTRWNATFGKYVARALMMNH